VTDSYSVTIVRDAEKELRDLPKKDLARVDRRIQALAETPRPQGVEKLTGADHYRIRQGDWRVVYEIDDHDRRVTVIKIGHRREVYR